MMWKIVTLCTCLCTVSSISVPSWEPLRMMLHEKLEDIYQNDKSEVHKKLQAGKYFKHYLSTEPGTYKAVQDGTDKLPHWLTFDEKKKKLQGVPMEADVQKGLKIVFIRTDKKVKKGTKTLILDVVTNTEPFRCKETSTVASVIFHGNMKTATPHMLMKFMRHFAHKFDAVSIHDLYIENGNKMDGNGLLNSQIRMAGPGDNHITGTQPGFTISWKLKCGVDISGHPDIAKLRYYSQKQNFKTDFTVSALGWLVTSTRSTRNRRAVGLNGTPGATPTVSVQGTPTITPSASVDMKSKVPISSITPSKTVPPMLRTSIITEPPTTQPSTKKPTTTADTPTTTKPIETTVPGDKTPKVNVIDKIEPIEAHENTPMVYNVPASLFVDENELTIELLYLNKTYTTDVPSWITYVDVDKQKNPARKLYIFPGDEAAGRTHKFALKATNMNNNFVRHFFEVKVRRDRFTYKAKFNLKIDFDYDIIANSVEEKVKLLGRISQAMYIDTMYQETKEPFRDVQFSRGSVVVQWSIEKFADISCNSPDLPKMEEILKKSQFENSLLPEYPILNSSFIPPKCPAPAPIPTGGDNDGNLWERILIPVIVIVIILLIIALILCCVYRRKRSYETATEQDETYLNHKKPVIFLEEFDEKPDFVSLQPLILPNEKPPVPDQAYGPRGGSPDAPESSTTVSTESDENAPLAPKSPKDRSGYNAPPPYSAR